MTTPTPTKKSTALTCPPSQVGLCARCQQPCHRYGFGGNPLCVTCRSAVEAARSRKPKTSA
ncbi:hypothetical protein ACFUJY_29495 [Streptomyces sp. NPDC057249]|uniref:hypothetical protein n=1 Tax=Streptomyces sp. NPDC057249 TaxID=3346067 RepID=UPI0036351B27